MKADLNPQQLRLLFLDEPIDHTIRHTHTFFAFARFWCFCLDVLDILSPLSALGQIMLYVDGMNGVIGHVETIQWLYTLVGSKVNTPVGARAEKKTKNKIALWRRRSNDGPDLLHCAGFTFLLFRKAKHICRCTDQMAPSLNAFVGASLFINFFFQSSTNTTGM